LTIQSPQGQREKPRPEPAVKCGQAATWNGTETLLDGVQVGSLTGNWHFLKLGYGDDTNGFFKLAEDPAKLSVSQVFRIAVFM
jgi:hypothetical protein